MLCVENETSDITAALILHDSVFPHVTHQYTVIHSAIIVFSVSKDTCEITFLGKTNWLWHFFLEEVEVRIAACDSYRTVAVFLPLSQVCVDNVMKTMKENANKASSILLTAIPQISQMDWAQTMKTLKVSCWLYDDSFPFSKSLEKLWKGGLFTFFLTFFYYFFLSWLSWAEICLFFFSHQNYLFKLWFKRIVKPSGAWPLWKHYTFMRVIITVRLWELLPSERLTQTSWFCVAPLL